VQQALHLHDPGVCFTLITKVWDHPLATVGANHFNREEPTLLGDDVKNRLRHRGRTTCLLPDCTTPGNQPPLVTAVGMHQLSLRRPADWPLMTSRADLPQRRN
jgi:hypothetical protein